MTVPFGPETMTIIRRWCEARGINPNSISAYPTHRTPNCPPNITYHRIENSDIEELTDLLDHTQMTLYIRSKPIKE